MTCPAELVVATAELVTGWVVEVGVETALVVVAALAADEEVSALVAADDDDDDVVAVVDVKGAAALVVATSVEVGAAVVDSEETGALDSGASKPRIWMAPGSPIGSFCDAETRSSIAEATTASNNERVVFFILRESAGSASNEKGLWNECGRKIRSHVGLGRKTTPPS